MTPSLPSLLTGDSFNATQTRQLRHASNPSVLFLLTFYAYVEHTAHRCTLLSAELFGKGQIIVRSERTERGLRVVKRSKRKFERSNV